MYDTTYDKTFSVPLANQNGTGATASLPTQLWYFYRYQSTSSSSTTLMRTTFDTSYVDATAFSNSAAWAEPEEVKIPNLAGYAQTIAAGDTPVTEPVYNPVSIFALTLGQRIYLFWSDSNGRLMGTRSAGDDQWEPAFEVASVAIAPGLSHGVSGYVFEGKVVLSWLASINGDTQIQCNSFSEDGIAPADENGQIWTPDTATPTAGPHFTSHGVSSTLSAGWTVLPSMASATESVPVGFFATLTSAVQLVSCYQLDPASGLPVAAYEPGENLAKISPLPAVLDLDASNTMYVYTVDSQRHVLRRAVMDAAGLLQAGTDVEVTGPSGAITTYDLPQIGYVSGSAVRGQLRTSTAPDATLLNTLANPLYRVIFCSSTDTRSNVWVTVQFYGLRHVVTTVNDLYLNDGSVNNQARQQALVAKGIIDGPLPVPAENLRMMSQGGTVAPWDLYKPIARVTYGQNRTDNTTHQVTVSGMRGSNSSFSGSAGLDVTADESVSLLFVGLSQTAYANTEMFGGRKDSSLQISVDHVLSSGEASVHEANVVGLTRVLPDGAASEDAPPVLSDQAYVAGAALSIVCLAVAFEDAQMSGILPARPSVVTFLPQTKVQLAANYTANYAFTPGDLASYAPDRIDARMATLYSNWRAANPGANDPFGEAYNSYFANVVLPAALPIGSGGRRYLEISINNDGFTETKFDLTRFNFEEWGTTVDKSTYSAFTWENLDNVEGYEFKSFLEEGRSFEFGAGYVESTERSEQWGVSAEMFNFPQATHSGHVSSYTLRVYFLPADNRWAQELNCFSDYSQRPENGIKTLDPNSRPWKIMFAVDPASIVKLI